MDVILAPSECKKLQIVKLPRPKDGVPQDFFHDEDNLTLYEIVRFSDKYRSWFIDNLLCKDGHYNMLTKVDPLFIFLPHLMKQARNMFRPLDDICREFSTNNASGTSNDASRGDGQNTFGRLESALSPDISWSNVCDTKELDDNLFLKFSEKRTLEWLMKKHDRLMDKLRADQGVHASKATIMSIATDLINDYVPEELCEKFKAAVKEHHLICGKSN